MGRNFNGKFTIEENNIGVVDNQINANDPPCTKEIYEELMEAGYSGAESKDKIGAMDSF